MCLQTVSFKLDSFSDEAELLRLFESQFRKHAGRMLRQFPIVRRWEQTDDIVQVALIRLHFGISSLQVKSPTHLRRLAAVHLRRQLQRRWSEAKTTIAKALSGDTMMMKC
ncbi:hypothetical protein [Novipirellula artificiosorum]|uniref:RNA polymerase sigma factor n=1 Tax=Novipirellula artificiosorum TaxID=2528016 RepID=A0A5C6E693_9BACT|nr:hypothetical protein [Novipirellula artificiosorum]TWU42689.1 hypothetical protein Poly41_09890 [Novipirellula artificiosorum]